jgi:hypothetical protein
VFTLSNLKIFNSENVKNKEYMFTLGPRSQGYASTYYMIDGIGTFFDITKFKKKMPSTN